MSIRKIHLVILSPSARPIDETCRQAQIVSLRTESAKRGIVILSPALGGTKDLEILRRLGGTPQIDIRKSGFPDGHWLDAIFVKLSASQMALNVL